MKFDFKQLLLAAFAFSLLIIPAHAANIDSTETSTPENEIVASAPSEDTESITPRADTYWTVKYNNVHIRSGAGTSYPSYGLIHSGQIVLWDSYSQQQYGKVYADGHYWMKVIVYTGVNTDVEGWVAADNLQKMNVR